MSARSCPMCDAQLRPRDRFCSLCGLQLSNEPHAEPTSAEQLSVSSDRSFWRRALGCFLLFLVTTLTSSVLVGSLGGFLGRLLRLPDWLPGALNLPTSLALAIVFRKQWGWTRRGQAGWTAKGEVVIAWLKGLGWFLLIGLAFSLLMTLALLLRR
jgi:hypothetical protein